MIPRADTSGVFFLVEFCYGCLGHLVLLLHSHIRGVISHGFSHSFASYYEFRLLPLVFFSDM